MKYYFENRRITETQSLALERTGAAHIAYGAFRGAYKVLTQAPGDIADHPIDEPMCVMDRGPGNPWLETLEGNCPECGCMAKDHLLNWDRDWLRDLRLNRDPLTGKTDWKSILMEKNRYRVQCQGCQDKAPDDEPCHYLPPHANADDILERHV